MHQEKMRNLIATATNANYQDYSLLGLGVRMDITEKIEKTPSISFTN